MEAFWLPTGFAARAWSLCRVTKRLVAPIEIAKAIIAALLGIWWLFKEVTVLFKWSTGASSLLEELSSAALLFFLNARFKDDLL